MTHSLRADVSLTCLRTCVHGLSCTETLWNHVNRYRTAAEMHFQKSIAQYASEASLPAAMLGRVEARMDVAALQVTYDPALAIGTLGSVATGVHKALSKMVSDVSTLAVVTKLQTCMAKVILTAIKTGPVGLANDLKGVYKKLLTEMQVPVDAGPGSLAKKGVQLAAILRPLSQS